MAKKSVWMTILIVVLACSILPVSTFVLPVSAGDVYIDEDHTYLDDPYDPDQYDFDETIIVTVDVDKSSPGPLDVDVFVHFFAPNDVGIDQDSVYGWTVEGTTDDLHTFYLDVGWDYMEYMGQKWRIRIIVRDSETLVVLDEKRFWPWIGPRLIDHFTCRDYNNPHATMTTTFYDTDSMACDYAEWDTHGLYITYSIHFKWYEPSGSEYFTWDSDLTPGSTLVWRYSYIWIEDHYPAEHPGSWHVDLYLESYFKARDDFDIIATTESVTVDPNGGRIFVDGDPITVLTAYSWSLGSTHTLDPDSGYSPSDGLDGKRLLFTQWDDGNTADPRTITVTGAAIYRAEWQTQYWLIINVSPLGGGTTNPAVGTYWYDSGHSQTVSESPNSGYTFDHWDLDGSNVGSGTSYTVTMNAPHTLTAIFRALVPDFGIWADPVSLSIERDSSDTTTVYVNSIEGFDADVSLSVSDLPSGVSYSYSKNPVHPPPDGQDSSTLTFSVSSDATTGAYYPRVVGTSGSITHDFEIELEITDPPDVALVKEYFPVYKFSVGEQWYPCSFYFDGNGQYYDDLYNKENYDSYTPWPPPYYAYVHILDNSTHKAIQYWLYYVWNYHQHILVPEHYSDWDSTVFIILEKTGDELVPVTVYYFFHHSKEHLSWNDWPEKEDTTHPIVYVAEGSHGAYSSPDEMIDNWRNVFIDDVWQSGGTVLREEDFNWYLVGDSEGHNHGYSFDWYCDMTVEWIEGEPQWEFDNYWWPRKFPQCESSPEDPFGSPMDPPWHRDKDWMKVQPVWSILSIFGFSPINFLVTDPNGLRVGHDPQSGECVFEIPGALYSGSDAEPETIIIPDPIYGNYTTLIVGTETGTYNYTLSRIVNEIETYREEHNNVEIEQNETQTITSTIYALADIAVTELATSKTIIGQGYTLHINVTIANHGSFSETFNVTVYYDETAITLPDGKNHTTTTLTSGNSTTITLTWNTTGIAKGNYTITAYANPVPGETDTADNTLTDGTVKVTIPGDANGDGEVATVDLSMLGRAWDTSEAEPHNELLGTDYNPNCDFNGDTKIGTADLSIMGRYWGQIDP